ncbi:MAG: GAF domain-containing protein [Bacteroidales bacterium]|nr:GAF domain-containing protein [Bacteroidales bacterium]MBN2819159.1 GAF domain-containing protein [Bacteroidales bacterium]
MGKTHKRADEILILKERLKKLEEQNALLKKTIEQTSNKIPDFENDAHPTNLKTKKKELQLSANLNHTENRFFESDSKLKEISKEFPGIIFQVNSPIKGKYITTYLSEGTEKMFNKTVKEIIDSQFLLNIIHPDDKSMFIESVENSRENLTPWELEYRILEKENTQVKWLRGKSKPHLEPDGSISWNGILLDITTSRSADLELKKSKTFFEQLFIQSATSTQLLDSEGWCIRINPKLSELFGVMPEAIEGKKYNIFHDGEIIRTGAIDKLKRVFEHKETVLWEVNFNIGYASETTGVKVSKPEKKWLLNKAYPILDNEGEIEYVIIQHEEITRSKIAEEELSKTKLLLEATFEQSPIPMVLVSLPENNLIYLNNAAKECLGILDQPDTIGKSMKDLDKSWEDYDESGNKVDKNNLPLTLTFKGIRTEAKEMMVKRKDGQIRWIMASATPIYNKQGELIAGYVVFPDISKLKEIEKQLINSKEKAELNEHKIKEQNTIIELNNRRLESLLKMSQLPLKTVPEFLDFALHEAIVLTNSKIGYIYYYNESKRQFTLNTWSKEVMKECEVLNPQTIYDLDSTGCWGEAVRQRKPIIINNYAADSPIKKGTPEGHVKLEKFLTIPVIIEDEIVAVAAVANKPTDYDQSDIRQLSLLMDNVWKITNRISLINDLKISKEKAEESDKLKTIFLQNISHEIRTPMNGILGFTKMLDTEDISDEDRQSYISIIDNCSAQLLNIVDDILTISSLETNQAKIEPVEINMNETIRELERIFRENNSNEKIEISATTDLSDKQSIIIADKTKLTQVLTNLVSNAVKFTESGLIKFGYRMENNMLLFHVTDNGIGIDNEEFGKIFDRFYQIEKGNRSKYGGTGLGLSICKEFVNLMGGKIWVESTLNKGTSFYFTIPYQPVNSSALDDNVENSTQKDKIYDFTILVAEDDDFNFILIQEILKSFKCNIIRANNGEEAVELVKANSEISLILMDIKMPVMDGYEAAKIIKDFNQDMYIIAQTAYALPGEVNRYGHVFNDYITKPIASQKLIQTLNMYIAENK